MKTVQVHLIIGTTLDITADDRFSIDTYVSDLCKKSELQSNAFENIVTFHHERGKKMFMQFLISWL